MPLYIHMYACRPTYGHACIHAYIYAYTHIHIYIHICIHAQLHTYIQYMHACVLYIDTQYTYMYVRNHAHTFTHAHNIIHAYIHAYIDRCNVIHTSIGLNALHAYRPIRMKVLLKSTDDEAFAKTDHYLNIYFRS